MLRPCAECGTLFKASPAHKRRFCKPECKRANWHNRSMIPQSIEARFWPKVLKTDNCWLWQGATNGQTGHGQFGIDHGHVYAHRYSYELAHGPIPPGVMVRHKCDNPPCVNPDHLTLGTSQQNVHDMVSRGRTHLQAHPEKARRGQAHHNARFNDADILTIRQLFADGMSTKALAQKYTMAATSVNRILSGRAWGHLPNPALQRYLDTRPKKHG